MSTGRPAMNIFLASAVTAALRKMQVRWIRKQKESDTDSTPAGKRLRISVAEGKRRAIKARNIRRHKLAMKRQRA